MSAAVSIHCCDRTASPFKAKANPGLRVAERVSERTAALWGVEHLEPAHQDVEQALARRLLGHVVIGAGEHRAVDLLHLRGEDRERRAECPAQLGQRDAGLLGDLGKADLLDRLLGEQRHERFDDPLARRLGRCPAARERRMTAWVCGPWPDSCTDLLRRKRV